MLHGFKSILHGILELRGPFRVVPNLCKVAGLYISTSSQGYTLSWGPPVANEWLVYCTGGELLERKIA
jgi:hypothetical protein